LRSAFKASSFKAASSLREELTDSSIRPRSRLLTFFFMPGLYTKTARGTRGIKAWKA
jgi:hypothetical protein